MLTIVRPILSPLKSSSPALCNRASYKKRKKGGNQNWIESNSSALLKKLELFFFFFFFLSPLAGIYMVYNMSKCMQNYYYYTSGYSIYSCIHLDVRQSRRRRWKKRKKKKNEFWFFFFLHHFLLHWLVSYTDEFSQPKWNWNWIIYL